MRGLVAYRGSTAALVAVVAAALLLPASCFATAGSLDRSFDGTGRLVIKVARQRSGGSLFDVTRLQPIAMASAAAPEGELVVAYHRRVLRFRANGRPRRHFSGDGRARIPIPAGMSFQLAGVAVDSRGRVLVAGTTKPIGASGGSRDARISVYRFMPNGKLDVTSGSRGVAGSQLGPMEATGLAVDPHGRPVLTGFSALTPSFCNTRSPVYLNTTVVTRLTTRGDPDPTFGGGSGTFTDPLEDPHLPALTPIGMGIVYVSTPDARCAGFEGYSGPVGAPRPRSSRQAAGWRCASRCAPAHPLAWRWRGISERRRLPSIARIGSSF